MPRSVGHADLPLHGGRLPKWLAERMSRLVAKVDSAAVQDERLRAKQERSDEP